MKRLLKLLCIQEKKPKHTYVIYYQCWVESLTKEWSIVVADVESVKEAVQIFTQSMEEAWYKAAAMTNIQFFRWS